MTIPSISLYEMFERTAEKFPNHLALSFEGNKMTYKELLENVKGIATSLQHKGIKKGDRVALMVSNCPEYVIAYYGILCLGGIVVQINPRLTARELKIILTDSGSKVMFVLDSVIDVVYSIYEECQLETLIRVNPNNHKNSQFADYLQVDFSNFIPAQINPIEDVAILQYTGGTTGVPKGVMLTHSNLIANLKQHDEIFKSTLEHGNEVVLGVLPLFHVYAMTIVMNLSIYQGSHLILLEKFQVDEVLNSIKNEHVTRFAGVPTMYIALNDHPSIENYNLEQVKVFHSGGASLPIEIIRSFENKVSVPILEAYGLTESSPGALVRPPKHNSKIGSVGLPLPLTEIKIVDIETGLQEMAIGEEGELIIKGPQIMKGYWGLLDETAYSLRDGWLYTGDIAKVDQDGFVYIVDRKKDLIIASGFNVYPREVEEVLFEHPAILEAAVIGVKDDYRGETIKAYVLLKDQVHVTEKDIIDFCKKSLVSYKVPKIIQFIDELPKTQVGKISRVALKNL